VSGLVSVTRPLPANGSVVLRTAQTVRLGDVVDVAPLPAPVRRLARRTLRRWWQRGLFSIVMALGFSVRETVPMRSLTLARPLGRAGGWASTAPRNALLVRLSLRPDGGGTDVSLSVDLDPSRTLRSRVVGLALRATRPLLARALGLWLTGLDARTRPPTRR
jgi:hypothetical protein